MVLQARADVGEPAMLVYPGGKTVTYTYDAGAAARARCMSISSPRAKRLRGEDKGEGPLVVSWAGSPTRRMAGPHGRDLLPEPLVGPPSLTLRPANASRGGRGTVVGSRLTKLTGGATTTYTYNAGGALTLEEVGGALTTYAFDEDGNTAVVNASGALTTMTWDGENRLSVIALPAGGVVTSVYDATGLRRRREDASGVTKYLWDGVNLLAETNSGGTTQARYTAALGQYGPVLSQRRSGTSAFYHAGALGTINRLTDASQNVTDLYALDAWGRSVASSGSTTNPHRYIGALGYYTEPDLGMDYVRARWLRPSTGSWVSVDPVEGEPRYGYVRGRAGTSVDPSGRLTAEQWSGAAWGFWGGGFGGAVIGAMCSTTRVEPFDNPYRRDLKTCEDVRDACLDSALLARLACERIDEFGFEEGTVTGYCIFMAVVTIEVVPLSAAVLAACTVFTVGLIGLGKWNDRRCRQQWEDAEGHCYERYRACRLR